MTHAAMRPAGSAIDLQTRPGRERVSRAWEAIAQLRARLRADPDDERARLEMVLACTELGLRTLAAAHLDRVSDAAKSSEPGVTAAAGLATLPDDRLSEAELTRTCSWNLEVLSRRGVDLRSNFAAWRARLAERTYFRALDGNVLCAEGSDGTDVTTPMGDLRGSIDRSVLPHKEASPRSAVIPPFVIEGINPPWLLAKVYRETVAGPDGYAPRITVLQADVYEALDGLAIEDLRVELDDPRVRVMVGEDASTRLEAELRERLALRLVGPVLESPGLGTRVTPAPAEILGAIGRHQSRRVEELTQAVRAIYAQRDVEWYVQRFAAARDGTVDEPVRVLIPTCRFTTYVRYAADDLADTLRSMGFEVELLMEPDDHSHLSAIAYLEMFERFRPDLVISINYMRANLGNAIPAEVPFVCWVQDSMPHQFSTEVASNQTPLDFLAGLSHFDLTWRFGFDRRRIIPAPMVVSSRTFHAEDLAEIEPACEIAYVSHHSETPEKMHQRKCREAAANAAIVEIFDELYYKIEAAVPQFTDESPYHMLRIMTEEALERRFGATDHDIVSQTINGYTLPLADRMFRQQTLAWTARIAEERGWRLHLYGNGWEHHPRFGQFARGPVARGDQLRRAYAGSLVNLQITIHTIVHQRIMECALCGGLPVCSLHADEVDRERFYAAHEAVFAGEPSSLREADGWAGYGDADHEAIGEYNDFRESVGLEREAVVWLHPDRLVNWRKHGTNPITGNSLASRLLAAAPGLAFGNREQLQSVLERAVSDAGWRKQTSASLANYVRDNLTTDAFAGRLIGAVRSSLEDSAGRNSR